MHHLLGFRGHPIVFMLLLFALAGIVVLFTMLMSRRGAWRGHASQAPFVSSLTPHAEALRLLDERLARGEVDPEDYKARRELLLTRS